MPNINQYIANNIRETRCRLGYSQFYVGYKIGLGQNAYSKIELGITSITVERLYSIAQALETDITALLLNPSEQKLLQANTQKEIQLLSAG